MSIFDLLFQEPIKLDYLDKDFGFEINPNSFIEWLKMEGQEISGVYKHDVTSMCEYSCLYISMLLYDIELPGDMYVYYGKFGMFEHYWICYKVDGEEYFIDLTLNQFVSCPRLAITKSMNERVSGGYSYLSDDDDKGITIREYVDSKRGFEFYTNPVTMQKPERWFKI